MKDTINTYFAILIITIAGAGASMLIVHIAFADVSAYAIGSEGDSLLQ